MLAGYTRVFNRPGVGKSWRLGERVAKKTLIILLGVCDGSEHFEKLKLKNYYTFIILKNPLNAIFLKKNFGNSMNVKRGKVKEYVLGDREK